MLAALSVLLLGWTPGHLLGQQDTAVSLDVGDQVRVWSSEAGWEGREFDVGRRSREALVLMEPDTMEGYRLSPSEIDRMQLRRRSGDRLLEGALVGGGVGLAASTAWAAAICAGPDYRGGVGCTLDFLVGGLGLAGVVPGVLLGGAIGRAVPEHEWVAVEVGPATGHGHPGGAPSQGAMVRVQLRLPAIP